MLPTKLVAPNQPRRAGQDDRVAVGQELGLVVEVENLRLVHRGQLGVDGVDIGLAEGVAGQVDLPQRVIASSDADDVAAQEHHGAAWLEVLGIAREGVGHRVVVPDHVAVQVGRQRVDGIAGPADVKPGVEDCALGQVGSGGRRLNDSEIGE